MEELVSFGEWVRYRRRKLDLTQQGLADRVHCSVDTIKKIETDARRPSKQLASLLAVELEIPKDQLSLFVDVARGFRVVSSLAHLPEQAVSDPQKRIHRSKRDLHPAPSSSLIGRESELELLMRLLMDSRLVTITGPGGVGKSTLAQAVLHKFQQLDRRCFHIPLVGVSQGGHIPFSIASVLGLDIPFNADPLDQIIAYLTGKEVVLVLDNFEHLLEAVPLLGRMLQATTTTRFIVTSRERLRLPEEQNFPLQGLRYPEDKTTPGDLLVYPAIQLFLERVRKINPAFLPDDRKNIIEICRLTEGMPLALEMIASWMDVMTPKDIVGELMKNIDVLSHEGTQVNARHKNMRAVFDASWQMLRRSEREVFACLCVFRGGFTRQAAEDVAGGDPSILSALAGHSMLKLEYRTGRYSIHELLRLYGEEELINIDSLEVARQSHNNFYLKQTETARSCLHHAEQEKWFDYLDHERDNIRAVLSHLLARHQKDSAAIMVRDLCWYWRIRSQVFEARQWLEQVLIVGVDSREVLASLYYHAGHFGWMHGDVDYARSHQLQSLELWRSLGNDGVNGMAYSRQSLGMIADLENNLSAAVEEYLASIHLFEESNDPWGVAFARHRLGGTLLVMGKMDEAYQQFLLCEQYVRECGDRWVLGLVLGYFAIMEFRKGNYSQARIFAEETRMIRADLGHTHSVIDVTSLLAQIAVEQGDRTAARKLLENAIELSSELGNQQFVRSFTERLTELRS